MAPAGARDAWRLYFAAFADAAAQRDQILVIDLDDLVLAEVTIATPGRVERTAPLSVGTRFAFGARHDVFLSALSLACAGGRTIS
jgi:hypothetical protein